MSLDYQVKVRGHRIELGEIEAVLEQHPQVKECVVTTYMAPVIEEQRLVAYLVPTRKDSVEIDKRYVPSYEKTLPDYMLPTDFVLLETFPLTHNKKIDRQRFACAYYLLTT